MYFSPLPPMENIKYYINLIPSVMHTLYSKVDNSLPTTSYMKVVEWWLLYHILIPILLFIILFLDNHRRQIVQGLTGKYLKRAIHFIDWMVFFGRMILPCISVLFVLAFVLIVSIHRLRVIN